MILQIRIIRLLLEVLVDDHSEDNTIEIVRNTMDWRKLPGLKQINLATDGFTCQTDSQNENKSGKKAAITAGISKATGDLILLTDADCRLGPAWVSSMVSYFKDEKKMMILGPVSYFPEKGLLNRFQSLEFSGLIASGAGAAMARRPFMCNGADLAYRKEVFLKVNGYEGNEKFISGDDVFLMHKIKEKFGNQSIGFAKNIHSIVRTYPAPGLQAFFRQRIRWASKAKGYHDKLAILTAVTVFTFNLFIFLLLGILSPNLISIVFQQYLLKVLLTSINLRITGFNKERRLMWWYLPLQVVYPLYILIARIASLFGKKN
jgi:cellulose synthase/poly-beta-1,6-N-acetylglucosamine synthase-like glycosyltransferase